MAKARLRIIGSGEAFDHGIGNCCTLLEMDGARLLFDCGYQIPERLWALPATYPRLDGVCFTHLHADHSFGIVPLLARFWEERRTRPLWLLGPPGTRAFVKRLFDLGYPKLWPGLGFEVRFVENRAGAPCKWKSLRLRFARTSHSVLNHAVRVEGPGGWSFGISGDGQMTIASRELFRGADFVFQEVYSRKPRTGTHCDLETLRGFVDESGIGRRIGVTHHARGEKAAIRREVRRLARSDPRWVALEPGMEFELSSSG